MPDALSARRKPITTAALTVALALLAVACQNGSDDKGATPSASKPPAPSSPPAPGFTPPGTPELVHAKMPGPHHEFSGPALVERAVMDSVNDPSFIVAMDMRSKSNHTRGRITISGSGDCEGRLFRGRDGTMEILRKDGQAYLRPDETMLRTPGKDGVPAYSQAEAALVKGKWIKVPKADAEGNAVFDLCDFKKLIHEGYDPDLRYERAGTFKIRGTRTARVTAKDSSSQVTYYIAGNPSPRLWRVELSGPEGTGYLAVTDYHIPFFPQEPPAGQIVDLSQQRS